MRRRDVLVSGGSAAVLWPLALGSQEARKVYRVGLLWDSPAMFPKAIEALRQALREKGWVEGQNLSFEPLWTEGHFERIGAMAEELVRSKVDVMVAPSSIYAGAAQRATSTIPIVFVSHADPLGSGHVASLSRPGGNITGVSLLMTETNAKSLELLKEAISTVSQVAVIYDPATPSHVPGLKALQEVGPTLGMSIVPVPVASASEFEDAFSQIAKSRSDAVLVLSTPLYMAAMKPLADLAIKYRLPSMFGPREHIEAGGLLSYSPDRADLWHRGAAYVDRILRGANPADLPVQQPTKFDLAINLRTAKALGITIPPNLLARADEVIE
jgi:putative tryptophan/tyrosine transport system substrate-binding protein